MNIMMDSGANFCHVDRIIHDTHDKEDITDGNHMWHGTIPNLMINDISRINIIIDLLMWILDHKALDIISNNLEPSA